MQARGEGPEHRPRLPIDRNRVAPHQLGAQAIDLGRIEYRVAKE